MSAHKLARTSLVDLKRDLRDETCLGRVCPLLWNFSRRRADGAGDAGWPAASGRPAPAGSGPATNGTPPAPSAAAPTGKEARQQCRDAAIAKGLRGDARKTDVKDCFAKARPDLAAANQCREEGKAKGLADKELKAFVKQCKTAAQ